MGVDLFVSAYRQTDSVRLPPLMKSLVDYARSVRVVVHVGQRAHPSDPRAEFVTKDFPRFGFTKITVRARAGIHELRDGFHAMLLAHELGHHRAWLNREDDAAYTLVASSEPQTLSQRAVNDSHLARVVLDAEARAWRHARDVLTEVGNGFSSWTRFDTIAALTYATYSRALSRR